MDDRYPKQFHYGRCPRADKGILQYLGKVTGFSHAQVARCIKQFNDDSMNHVTLQYITDFGVTREE